MNGMEALEKAFATTEAFDLYPVDINMPRIVGYAFLRELRQQAIRQTPTITVSTEGQSVERACAFEAGASFHRNKPIKPDDLFA